MARSSADTPSDMNPNDLSARSPKPIRLGTKSMGNTGRAIVIRSRDLSVGESLPRQPETPATSDEASAELRDKSVEPDRVRPTIIIRSGQLDPEVGSGIKVSTPTPDLVSTEPTNPARPQPTPTSGKQLQHPERIQPASDKKDRITIVSSEHRAVTEVSSAPSTPVRVTAQEIPNTARIHIAPTAGSGSQILTVRAEDLRPIDIVEIDRPSTTSGVLIQPAQRKIIRSHELRSPPARLIITQEDVVRPTTVLEPLDGSQVGQRSIPVHGEAQPNTQLGLMAGEFRDETRVASNGIFRFSDVPLQDAWNQIQVWSLSYPGFARCQQIIRVYRQERPLLFVGQRDLFSQSVMSENDAVVRCQRCYTFSRLDSWQHVPGCANCLMYVPSNRYWTKDDVQFYEERHVSI